MAVDFHLSPNLCLLKFVYDCVPCVVVLRCPQVGERPTRAKAGTG